jgi:hypothetical protein
MSIETTHFIEPKPLCFFGSFYLLCLISIPCKSLNFVHHTLDDNADMYNFRSDKNTVNQLCVGGA